MLRSLKRTWRELKRGPPGKRFQNTHENARRHRSSTPLWQRAIQLGFAIAAFVLGLVFAVLPGPAFVFFGLAGALLALESRPVAMALDWLELRLRAIGRWAKRHWRKLKPVGRAVVVALGAGGTAAAALTVWMLLRR